LFDLGWLRARGGCGRTGGLRTGLGCLGGDIFGLTCSLVASGAAARESGEEFGFADGLEVEVAIVVLAVG